MAAFAGLKRAALLSQPSFELIARHTVQPYNTSVV
jgi:hypothetical protein